MTPLMVVAPVPVPALVMVPPLLTLLLRVMPPELAERRVRLPLPPTAPETVNRVLPRLPMVLALPRVTAPA